MTQERKEAIGNKAQSPIGEFTGSGGGEGVIPRVAKAPGNVPTNDKGGTHMAVKIVRSLFILACIIMGVIWARYVTDQVSEYTLKPINPTPWLFVGGLVGGSIGALVLILLSLITQELFERISPAIVAIVLAMLMGYALGQYILMWFPGAEPNVRVFLIATLVLLFGFSGISLGLTRASNWESLIQAVHKRPVRFGTPKVVDTSVIIDGRVADICETGFLDGTLIVPRFVLRELQNIADSADVLRRAKGRRGLDILKAMQENSDKVFIMVVEDDYPDIREVDGKLLRLAKDYGAKVLTNDYNLNKVAQIEGVAVLNINDLANAIKPAVLPDEQMQVKILKEGKEAFQGVGYLDDGTMVVVDGGKEYIGRSVSVVVTSVLQTAAGRMIFGKLSGIVA